MSWSALPFMRATGGLIVGIVVKEALSSVAGFVSGFMLSAAVIFAINFFLVRIYKTYRVSQFVSVFSIVSFAMLGFLSATLCELMNKPNHSVTDLGKASAYTAIIRSNPSPTEKTVRYEVLMDLVKIDGAWIHGNDKAILYLIGDTISYGFGDKILVTGSPEFVSQNTNPHAFNYGKYLQRRGIYLQDFVDAHNCVLMSRSNEFSIKYWSMQTGDRLESLLKKYITAPREFHVAKAMVLGRREEITPEMEFVYQATGTAHILAVSGLHVGIIYFLFSFLFQFLKERHRWIYNGSILLGIWSFALITGMSPSVQRAAFMLSIFIFAAMLSRRSNTYNSILVSAFIMLLVSPNLLFSVSFQLSYLAVFGIIFLYDMIYRRLYFKYAIPDFLWKITSVSLAVQIVTFPVTIFYFNQFPTLFLLTNLVAIPTAMLVLGSSMILFSFSFINIIPELIGKLTGSWIYCYNELLLKITQFSFANIQDLQLKAYAVFGILVIIFLLITLIDKRDVLSVRVLAFVLVLFAIARIHEAYVTKNQRQLVLYDIGNRFYFDIINGGHCYTNTMNNVDPYASEVDYNISPNRKFHRVRSIQPIDNYPLLRKVGQNYIMSLARKTVFILCNPMDLPENIREINFDYLVINMRSLSAIEGNLASFPIEYLILDNSITETHYDRLMQRHSLNFAVHSIRRHGAYVVDI